MNTLEPQLIDVCQQLGAALRARGWRMASAESCTGGLIAATCTGLSGASDWFECGFVCYSNAAKSAHLGVSPALIEQHGAVSEPVVRALAEGALWHSLAQVSVAVSGIAGPLGGSPSKPVGTVCLGWASPAGVRSQTLHFEGDRAAVRAAAVRCALQGLLEQVAVG